jgi:hypothetical protein
MQVRMPGHRRPTKDGAIVRTLAAECGVPGVLGVAAYGVYADGERGERPEVAAPSIAAKPAKVTDRRSARLRFSDRERGVSFQCLLDRAGWRACSSPRSYRGPLALGRHRFQMRAVRWLGELEYSLITSYVWAIDLRAPAPRIVRHPANPTLSSTATFVFADRERRARCTRERRRGRSPSRSRTPIASRSS